MKYSYRIAATAVGCVLGAGFLSGQELLSFFGAFGVWGLVGTAVAALFFYLTVSTLLSLAQGLGAVGTDRLVLFFRFPAARVCLLGFEVLFLFLIYVLMIAAAGSLLQEMLGLPTLFGNLLFCLLTVACALFGIRGLVRIFAWLVPPLALAALIVAGVAIVGQGIALAPLAAPSFAFIPSAVVYVSFNIVCSIPLLAPVGKEAPDKRSIRIGTALAALVLTLIALFILLALSGREALAENDLPMLALAEALSPALGILYACLLFGGIFSTGFSTMTALGSYCTDRFGLNRPKTALVLGVLSLLGMLIARSGFRELVGFFYPVFGYLGLVPLLFLFLHALIRRFKKGNNRNKGGESGQEFSGNQENTQV